MIRGILSIRFAFTRVPGSGPRPLPDRVRLGRSRGVRPGRVWDSGSMMVDVCACSCSCFMLDIVMLHGSCAVVVVVWCELYIYVYR